MHGGVIRQQARTLETGPVFFDHQAVGACDFSGLPVGVNGLLSAALLSATLEREARTAQTLNHADAFGFVQLAGHLERLV